MPYWVSSFLLTRTVYLRLSYLGWKTLLSYAMKFQKWNFISCNLQRNVSHSEKNIIKYNHSSPHTHLAFLSKFNLFCLPEVRGLLSGTSWSRRGIICIPLVFTLSWSTYCLIGVYYDEFHSSQSSNQLLTSKSCYGFPYS